MTRICVTEMHVTARNFIILREQLTGRWVRLLMNMSRSLLCLFFGLDKKNYLGQTVGKCATVEVTL